MAFQSYNTLKLQKVCAPKTEIAATALKCCIDIIFLLLLIINLLIINLKVICCFYTTSIM